MDQVAKATLTSPPRIVEAIGDLIKASAACNNWMGGWVDEIKQ